NRVKTSTKKIHCINILPKKGRFAHTPSTGFGILCQQTLRGAGVGLEKGEKTSSFQHCHFDIAAMFYAATFSSSDCFQTQPGENICGWTSGVTLNLPGPGRFSVLRECEEVWRQRERLEVFLQEEKM
ncbi:hypothetical protein Nmel_003941, partial [Mimus melanotis]